MIIQHNMNAINASRQLGLVRGGLAKSAEKLSSGYRINRAADDAAGLSISEKMRRQVRGLNQSIANTEDGVSLCQVADGALGEVHDMIQRLEELSVKAANGTNSGSDRQAIQDEIDGLLTEINRISDTTKFNEHIIFGGSEVEKITALLTLPTQPTTPTTPTPTPPAVGGTVTICGDFTVQGGTLGTDFEFDSAQGILRILTATPVRVSGTTNQHRIEVAYGVNANVILKDVNINLSNVPSPIPNAFYDGLAAFAIAENSTGNVNIFLEGTSILKSGASSAGLQKNGSTGTLTISGTGSLKAMGKGYGAGIGSSARKVGSNITITSGTVEATGGTEILNGGAGIGCGAGGNGSNITIEGGKVTAAGGSGGAGIGCGSHIGYDVKGSNITIKGGEVTATGGPHGAGIGGGSFGSGSNITIEGGKVAAVGGGFAAGIGGGGDGNGSNITIKGGQVTATGGGFAAGIGGASGGNGSNITIEGGEVTAAGGGGAAGIGGGSRGDGSDITIKGGGVEATGGNWGAGIGGGENGKGDRITISGGSGQATGGQSAQNIGSGKGTRVGLGTNVSVQPTEGKASGINTGTFYWGDKDKPTEPPPPLPTPTVELIVKSSNSLWIQSGHEAGDGIFMGIDAMSTAALRLDGMNVATAKGADNAMKAVDFALAYVSALRSKIGAYQNRLEHTIANEGNIVESTTSAESGIRDTDMAKEMVRYSNLNILAQAGQSMLAQANQSVQGVLSLVA